MPYCPQCLTEYFEGSKECIDCGAPLQPGAPPPKPPSAAEPDVTFVPVRLFRGLHAQFQADLSRNVLEAEGIPSTLTSEYAAEMIPGADVVQVLVRQDDQVRASQVLADFFNTSAPQAETAAGEAAESSAGDSEPV
ncbi:MAG TPA: hypothetical protein VI455_00380 [Terriglobia bacterium]